MKIRGVSKTQSTSKKKSVNTSPTSISFDQIMAVTEEGHEKNRLDEKFDDISKKGKELAEKKDIEILLEYKELIRSFVDEAVNFGLKVVEKRGSGRAGRTKLMRIVTQIDEKLIKLTDELIEKEQTGIKLLSRIGELHGLLLNLYA